MVNKQELKRTLSYIHAELNRMETIAGTLATVEQEHFNRLTQFDHRELSDIAIEEKNAARQLGTMKHMCLSMVQKIEEIKNTMEPSHSEERIDHVEVH